MMAVTGLNKPDFRTVAEFRRRYLAALSALFVQVLKLCEAAGLVRLGHVAVDETKLKANASRHKAMSYGRMKQAEPKLAAEVAVWLATAEARTDPSELDPQGPGPSSGMQERGRRKRAEDGGPPDAAQRNFTNPDSRIQWTRDGFIAGYNGQIAVDQAHPIILAHRLATNPADYASLIPLVDLAEANLGRKLEEVSGDSGFATESNLAAMAGVHPVWPDRGLVGLGIAGAELSG